MSTLEDGNLCKVNLSQNSWVVIREQNGEDDDIISNPTRVGTGEAFADFLRSIIVDYSKNLADANGSLTSKHIFNHWPVNYKYILLYASRIHSLGNMLVFEYDWGIEGVPPQEYEEDLNDFLLEDYAEVPTEEELNSKPYVVPMYPNEDLIYFINLKSGKKVRYRKLTLKGEAQIVNLPQEKRTKNCELIARELELDVLGKWEKVENFRLFSIKDMVEIRRSVAENDPVYDGMNGIPHPQTNVLMPFYVLGIKDFFYPEVI